MNTELQDSIVKTKIYAINKTEFHELLPAELNTLEELSGTKQSWENYTGLLPVEVVTSYKLVEPIMWRLEVWEVQVTPDPFLVGTLPSKLYFSSVPTGLKKRFKQYDSFSLDVARALMAEFDLKKSDFNMHSSDGLIRHYLIAQWGRELKEMKELMGIAKNKFMSSRKRQYTEEKLQAEKNLAMLELDAEDKFGLVY